MKNFFLVTLLLFFAQSWLLAQWSGTSTTELTYRSGTTELKTDNNAQFLRLQTSGLRIGELYGQTYDGYYTSITKNQISIGRIVSPYYSYSSTTINNGAFNFRYLGQTPAELTYQDGTLNHKNIYIGPYTGSSSFIGFNLKPVASNIDYYSLTANGGSAIYADGNGNLIFTCISGTPGGSFLKSNLNSTASFRITPSAAYAKKIVVQTSVWADNVFRSGYNLRSLKDVESFITENEHLPEIPSEQEVLEDGIDVSEMNMLLLKKVEELTLYLIEQQKEIDELKAKQ